MHRPKDKISLQIGDGEILSNETKKPVVYNFRENDIRCGGEGAPLTPIFHKLLAKKFNLKLPLSFLNIGGISNITTIDNGMNLYSSDIGPGNCMIDNWIRINSNKSFDENGSISKKGNIDKFILDQTLDNYFNSSIVKKRSLDINDFDIQFIRGLSFENGARTLTEITAEILSSKIKNEKIYVCGGGRKNKLLIELIEKKIGRKLFLIDDLNIDGDFIESQAFAYLAIRSKLGKPISFPETTGCKNPSVGGTLVKNF